MSLFPDDLTIRARDFVARAAAKGMTVATVESCTGGLVAGLLTEIAGSSAVVDRGFVTYSDAAKTDLVGVPAGLIRDRGAVSQEVARAMAEGGIARSGATIAIAITGIAGPGGGSDAKPVGLVHLAAARRGGATTHIERRYGDLGRHAIRLAAIADALALLEAALES